MHASFDFSKARPAEARLLHDVPVVQEQPGRVLINAGPSPAGWHRLETFLRCPQLYAYKFPLKGLVPLEETRDALERGGLLHVGLAHHYARWEIEQRGKLLHNGVEVTDRDVFYPPEEAMALAAHASKDPETAAVVWAQSLEVVREAIAYALPRDRFRVVGVEQLLDARAGEGRRYTARADLVIENRAGIEVWDHKSAANWTKTTLMGYELSGQMHGLSALASAQWGSKFQGMVVNVLDTGAAPRTSFQRVPLKLNRAFTARMYNLIPYVEKQIEHLTATMDPWEWPVSANESDCIGRYGRCPAYAVCHGDVRPRR